MAKKELIKLKINGAEREVAAEPRMLLVHFIREQLGLTGTHVGCDTSNCGACTVLLNGKTVKSCTMFAVQADGAEIMTVEGLPSNGALHPLQEGFKEEHGLQCGFCTPGMLMSSYALLKKNPNPTRRGDTLGNFRQSLPLHRIPKHRQGRAIRRARRWRREVSDAEDKRQKSAAWATRMKRKEDPGSSRAKATMLTM